jgi:hypothetical protein
MSRIGLDFNTIKDDEPISDQFSDDGFDSK